jgi:zinc protease
MKVKLFGLALALLCGAAARAQTPAQTPAPAPTQAAPAAKAEEKLPSGEEVFNKYIAAVGGEAALSKFKSRVTKGSVELAPMGAKGTYETSQKAPDKLLTTMTLTGLGAFQQGYDGGGGWGKDPFNGLRDLKGGELTAVRRVAQLNQSDWRKLYQTMKVTGRAKVGEREVYVVEAAHGGDTPDKLYFDTQTGLLQRIDIVVDSPQGRATQETTFEDYREVDGVRMPHTSRAVVGPATIILRVLCGEF